MKSFLFRSIGLFGLAFAVTLGVFAAVSLYRGNPDFVSDTRQSVEGVFNGTSGESSSDPEAVSNKVPETGIPLNTLALSPEQISSLETLGVNTDTFVITKSMITCAEDKLGVARVQEIVGGSAPGPIEMAKLSLCLTAS